MPDNPMTVADLEHDLENAFDYVRDLEQRGQLPDELRPLLLLSPVDGTSVHVSLRHRDMGRQIRRTYGAQAFDQRDGAAWIVFEVPRPDREESQVRFDERDDVGGGRHEGDDAFDEFIRALDEAENQPQLNFVSLKWFRDTYLVRSGYPWAQDPDMPRRILQDATDRNLVLTSKVPNPKQPSFPVTSIHLNRQHPDVLRILGAQSPRPDDRSDRSTRGPGSESARN